MTRELITRASYLNTNFNQVIYIFLRYVRNAFFSLLLMEVKSYKINKTTEPLGLRMKKSGRDL